MEGMFTLRRIPYGVKFHRMNILMGRFFFERGNGTQREALCSDEISFEKEIPHSATRSYWRGNLIQEWEAGPFSATRVMQPHSASNGARSM
jgi:hypothetical protein